MPDDKVRAAIRIWAPRVMAQGVDYNDYFRTTARFEKWDDWYREWSATGSRHAGLADQSEANGQAVTAGEAHIAAAL